MSVHWGRELETGGGAILIHLFTFHRITESQNHRMLGVGGDL